MPRFADVVSQDAEVWNFYSTGDEVFSLTESPGLLSGLFYAQWWFIIPTDYNLSFARHSWQKQELLKGTVYTTGMLSLGGTPHAGWGFTSSVLPPTQESQYQVQPVYSLAQANAASDADLRANPVFAHHPDWLVGANVLSQPQINEMLGMGIPALTPSTGRTPIPPFGEQRQFDLNTDPGDPSGYKPNGWPAAGHSAPDIGQWLHTDMKDVAYLYCYKLFDKIADKGGLK